MGKLFQIISYATWQGCREASQQYLIKSFRIMRTHSFPTHFELGFSVNAIVSVGRKAIEQHGEQSDNLEVFEH